MQNGRWCLPARHSSAVLCRMLIVALPVTGCSQFGIAFGATLGRSRVIYSYYSYEKRIRESGE
jgi:hypothetical protein